MRITLLVLLCAWNVGAAPASKPDTSTVTCKGAGDTRLLKIESKENGGCEVIYTKNGNTQSVASAEHEPEYCDAAVIKIRTTLEGAGFKCH